MTMIRQHYRYTLTHLALVCVLLSVPFVAEAQYKPLVEGLGIPGLSGTPTIAGVVNGLFNLALVLGSVLAVLIIAGSGLQYMSTDAVFQKKDSVYRMSYAILGLLMLLGTWLFFNEINPNILNLTISATQTSGGVSTQRADTTNTSRVVNNTVSLQRSDDPSLQILDGTAVITINCDASGQPTCASVIQSCTRSEQYVATRQLDSGTVQCAKHPSLITSGDIRTAGLNEAERAALERGDFTEIVRRYDTRDFDGLSPTARQQLLFDTWPTQCEENPDGTETGFEFREVQDNTNIRYLCVRP